MDSYQFQTNRIGKISGVARASDNGCIMLSTSNTDCVQFLTDWKAGATVLNADGSTAAYSDAAVVALGLTPSAE